MFSFSTASGGGDIRDMAVVMYTAIGRDEWSTVELGCNNYFTFDNYPVYPSDARGASALLVLGEVFLTTTASSTLRLWLFQNNKPLKYVERPEPAGQFRATIDSFTYDIDFEPGYNKTSLHLIVLCYTGTVTLTVRSIIAYYLGLGFTREEEPVE